MTLEKVVPTLAFGEDNLIPDSRSQKAKYFTLPHSPKCIESSASSKIIKDGSNINRHRVLHRTASDNTFLTSSSTSGLYSTNWTASIDRKSSCKNRHESTNDLKHTHSIQSYRHEHLVRNSSLKDQSNIEFKRSTLSPEVKSPKLRPVVVQEYGTISQRSTCSREILLEFPNTGDRGPNSKVGKRSERSKGAKPDRAGLHHSQSLPGLADEATKDRLNFADGKIIETKTRSFFLFFRKKNKTYNDISPSPSIKSNHQTIQRTPSNPYPISDTDGRVDCTPSPSVKGRRLSDLSSDLFRLPENALSISPHTPSSPRSVASPAESISNSPPSTEKLPIYISRSGSKYKKQSRRRKSQHEQLVHADDGLRLEDLPPHPSIYRKTVEKTYSYPSTPNLKHYRNSSSKIINNRFNSDSARRRNSMPESSATDKCISEYSEADDSVKEKTQSTQNLRKKSVESCTRTTSEEDSHCEYVTSSSDPRGLIHSRSVPKFGCEMYLPDVRVISDAEDFEYNPTDMTGPINLSLCGCGFLGMYHLGVVSCLAQRGPSFIERLEKVGGASVGAIMAAVLVTSRDKIEESAEHIQSLAKEIRKKPLGPLTPGYNFTRSLRYMLDDILPPDAHETSQGKLFISLTNADTKKNEMLSDFKSRDELIEALVASCFIPIYAGIKIPTIRGKKYIDGGLSNNMPKFETGRTITVSPFDGKSDIGPKVDQEAEKKAHFINVQNQDVQVSVNNVKKSAQAFFPPKRQSLQDYFDNGRYDANRFLIREGLYETVQPQKKAVLYESSV